MVELITPSWPLEVPDLLEKLSLGCLEVHFSLIPYKKINFSLFLLTTTLDI
jgi:hypothetical protein